MLNADGNIDVNKTKQIVQSVYPLQVTFHRAFDRCRDPFTALEVLIDLGCERILTSGQKSTVMEGISLIKQLHTIAADRIIIMPGSGVRPDNIRLLKEATGCIEFHSSMRTLRESKMEFVNKAFNADSYKNNAVDADEVRELRAALETRI
jgi:copper homeostasis protein